MRSVKLELKKAKKESHWGRSCLFGEPDLDKAILEEVADDEIFIAQINLEAYRRYHNTPLLPKKGMLSFFLHEKDMKPVIRYRERSEYAPAEGDVRVDFNALHESPYDLSSEYQIRFTRGKSRFRSRFLIENAALDELEPGDVVLFQYDSADASFMNDMNVVLSFALHREDLMNREYSKVRLIITRC